MTEWSRVTDERGRFAGLRREQTLTLNRADDGRIESIGADGRTFAVIRERGRIVRFEEKA